MTVSQDTIQLNKLPEVAQKELLDFYEFLKQKHASAPEVNREATFSPRDFRGILRYSDPMVKQHLDELRQEWDRRFD